MAVDSALLMLLGKEESASLICVFVILNYIFFRQGSYIWLLLSSNTLDYKCLNLS